MSHGCVHTLVTWILATTVFHHVYRYTAAFQAHSAALYCWRRTRWMDLERKYEWQEDVKWVHGQVGHLDLASCVQEVFLPHIKRYTTAFKWTISRLYFIVGAKLGGWTWIESINGKGMRNNRSISNSLHEPPYCY
jgi:hypothetical protein